ncbi:hypothetical protein FRC04_000835 [Tulasnella sp. 424]|nr:hypothetical protein FRC04_000835 [Tulasnella sp. 424]KAG8969430.1 hypothetical protein FRC05_001065 [Tulasnella sp. 425]
MTREIFFWAFVTVLGLVHSAQAWGSLGHKTVANVALNFLQPEVLASVQTILAADERKTRPNPSIVDVATWADEWSLKKDGVFSKPFHFIDANDDPPFECNVDLDRDCDQSRGCVVTAIANYTQQLRPPSRSNANDTAAALKFLVHFIGDVTQPLHTGGGLGRNVLSFWKGKMKRLHAVWDTDMVIKLAGPDNEESLAAWTNTIVNEINNGTYKTLMPEWLRCTDPSEALNCALQWAIDSNSLICTYVLKDDLENMELSGKYYQGAAPIIQQQIAKGGVRLAAWLNTLFGSGEPGKLPFAGDRLVIQNAILENRFGDRD